MKGTVLNIIGAIQPSSEGSSAIASGEEASTFESILATFSLTPQDFWMILVGVVAFSIFIHFMRIKFFAPYMALLELREAVTTGAQDSAQSVIANAVKLEQTVEASLTEARIAAMRQKLERLAVARSEGQEILKEAEKRAQEILSTGRQEQDRQANVVRSGLARTIDAMAQDLTLKVLSPIVSAPSARYQEAQD